MYINDRLYGRIELPPDIVRLIQTKEFARLRGLSLSAIPCETIPVGTCASRAEHSIAVWSLADVTARRPEFSHAYHELCVAALAHDLGNTPFCHLTEWFMEELTGVRHEANLANVLDGSEFAEIVRSMGVNLDIVLQFVTGSNPPLSKLINGTIDLDNLDNTLRYGVSAGVISSKNGLQYSPRLLANAYRMRDGKLALHDSPVLRQHLAEWANCRKETYAYVYSERNLIPGAMVARAIEFAKQSGELHQAFWTMTDAQAYDYLETRCNSVSQILMASARRWEWFRTVSSYTFGDQLAEGVKTRLSASSERQKIADTIAATAHIPTWEIAVQFGKNKGAKSVDLDLASDGGRAESPPMLGLKPSYYWQVYVHPRHTDNEGVCRAINDFATDYIGLN